MANRKYRNIVQARKARNRSDRKYKAHAQKAFTIRYHKVNDSAIIAKLKSVPNKVDYIRQLIIQDIQKERA